MIDVHLITSADIIGTNAACSYVRCVQHSPAGRVVRRAGSSSRRSGACLRAAAGPTTASTSSSSAGSIAPLYTNIFTGVQPLPATSSLFSPRVLSSYVWCSERRFTIVARDSQASS
ncbi:unnamed protein product [Arctia plantaginis]|uniref:Uncharacterized protein n=1 Tax=Arctia plantaginis TaxID=874455 RepID=A0A8S1BW31_ARCPL|nr:unnamed protein product [Arctia plantaginis]